MIECTIYKGNYLTLCNADAAAADSEKTLIDSMAKKKKHKPLRVGDKKETIP